MWSIPHSSPQGPVWGSRVLGGSTHSSVCGRSSTGEVCTDLFLGLFTYTVVYLFTTILCAFALKSEILCYHSS
ncbi:hypothetical protein J6590_049925 [Homalodisca vitripennis]|nr:hypothetical protein J6590_049925 [Homalodisca vitripennis]